MSAWSLCWATRVALGAALHGPRGPGAARLSRDPTPALTRPPSRASAGQPRGGEDHPHACPGPTAGPLRRRGPAMMSVEFPKDSLTSSPGCLPRVSSVPVGPQGPPQKPPPSTCRALHSPLSTHGWCPGTSTLPVAPGRIFLWGAQALSSPGRARPVCGLVHTGRSWPSLCAVGGGQQLAASPLVSHGLSPAGWGSSRGWGLHAGLHGHEALLRRFPGHLRAQLSG